MIGRMAWGMWRWGWLGWVVPWELGWGEGWGGEVRGEWVEGIVQERVGEMGVMTDRHRVLI